MVHWYVRDSNHGLTIHVYFMVKCVCDIWDLDLMAVSCLAQLNKAGHYKMYIISGVGHPRSDMVMTLMLWKVAYNIWV